MANMIGLDLKVDEKYIETSVQQIVKAAITQALGDPAKIVRCAVDNAIGKYVKDDGRECRSGEYGAKPYLDWLASKVIEDTAREVMKEVVEENKELFKEEIKKQLSNKSFRSDLAGKFLQTILESSESKWKMPISVNFEKPKDY